MLGPHEPFNPLLWRPERSEGPKVAEVRLQKGVECLRFAALGAREETLSLLGEQGHNHPRIVVLAGSGVAKTGKAEWDDGGGIRI